MCQGFDHPAWARLAAVGSSSGERARAFASDFGVDYAASSYEALFEGPPLDAVYVATPHPQHLALV
ncbi:MAG: Gfo/Idh/MocA family oxidoreductase, partial [Lewinella sp.]|nr:Gfo/Idh/MocA family oxidoreductase [Lewinella sp.]